MKQLVVLAILATVVTVAFVLADPFGLANQSTTNFLTALAITLEAFSLLIPSVALGFLLQRHASGIGQLIGTVTCFAMPIVMLVNAVTWRWIGDSLFSASLWRAVTDLRESLVDHITINVVLAMGYLLLAIIVTIAVLWIASRWIADFWESSRRLPGPGTVFIACVVVTATGGMACLTNLRSVQAAMTQSPFQHPWSVMNLVHSSIEQGAENQQRPSRPSNEVSLATAVLARQQQQRQVALQPSARGQSSALPDVLIVIVESFRRELVNVEVMPNLTQYANRGLVCRSHFSGGNATNHGVFSLVNGLEAIWHESPVRYSPLMNRLFREAGYELGFFGSHNDWRKFQMDGYISPEQFDLFDVAAPGGMDRDRQAVQAASSYLQRRPLDAAQRKPRLAVVYLYATHAPYRSYVDDQIFQPAADDRFLIPYTESSRSEVWNRYKNSAHSVDRLLSSLLRDDRVVVVTGDHGESFLDDGTIGHGIRISEFQNMTPAVLFAPSLQPRVINEPTMHADVLPTLLGILGLHLNGDTVLDGVDLLATTDAALLSRTFVTRDYLSEEVAVISSHPDDLNNVFASTGTVSLKRFHAQPRRVIDRFGNGLQDNVNHAFDKWLGERFGNRRVTGSVLGF